MNERRSRERERGDEGREGTKEELWREIRSVRVRQRGGEALMERLTTEEDEKKHSRKRVKEPGGSEGGRRRTETSRRRNKRQDVRKKRRRIRGGEGRDESHVSARCTLLLDQNADKHLVIIIIIIIYSTREISKKEGGCQVSRQLLQTTDISTKHVASSSHYSLISHLSRQVELKVEAAEANQSSSDSVGYFNSKDTSRSKAVLFF